MKSILNPVNAMAVVGLLSVAAVAGPVSYFGQLQAYQGYIYDSGKTTKVQLKGPSLYWSTNESIPYYNEKTIDWFSDVVNISVVRAAMAIQYWDSNGGTTNPIEAASNYGYITTANPAPADAKAYQMARIDSVVQAAIKNDIYVIVDWHSHRAQSEQATAVDFFKQMATKYLNVPNVIWEVYNEPPSGVATSTIYTYADAVISAIRGTGNTNLAIVGSPSWDQTPSSMASMSTPLHTKYANVAYSLHFYAATHKIGAGYDASAVSAMTQPSPAAVFVTEWGTVSADGTGTPDQASTSAWESWMDSHSISSCNWSVMAAATAGSDGSNMFVGGTGSNLSTNNLSASGNLFYTYAKGGVTVPTGYPSGKNVTYSLLDGVSKTIALTDVGASSGATFLQDSAFPATSGTLAITTSSMTYQQPTTSTSPGVVLFNYYLVNGTKKSKQRITININRKPIAYDTSVIMNYTAASLTVPISNLGVTDPDLDAVTFTSVTPKYGRVTMGSGNGSFVYTPVANFMNPATQTERDDTLSYTVTDSHQTVTKTVVVRVMRLAPTIYANVAFKIANDTVFHITRTAVVAKDSYPDTLTFAWDSILNPNYTGTLQMSADKKTLIFTPAANLIGTLQITYKITDGVLVSKAGVATLTISGTGTQIPTTAVLMRNESLLPTLRTAGGDCFMTLQQQALTRVEVFSYRGQKLKTAFDGVLSSGDHQVSLGLESLPKGVYIVRVEQGSQYRSVQAINY